MFYIASDLHLEFYDTIEPITGKIKGEVDNIPINERVLFLCGDVGNPFQKTYEGFLEFCSKTFRYVILITGNHEYYNLNNDQYTMTEVDNRIEELTISYENVIFLNKSYCILKEFKLVVFGTTLWSKIDLNARKGINDFIRIVTDESQKTNSNLTLSEYHALHSEHLKSVIKNIEEISQMREQEEYSDYDLIVMTHHLPSYDLINPVYAGHPINQFFASDHDTIIQNLNSIPTASIKYWFCGHTHHRMEKKLFGTKIIVHPYGYPFEHSHECVLRSI